MPLKTLKGNNGQIELYGSCIVIKRKGFLAKLTHGFTKGEKTISFDNISGIQVKKPGLTSGYIQFSISGGNESTGGVFQATQDENTVVFPHKKDYPIAEEIKSYILKHKRDSTLVSTSGSSADEILEFRKLADAGVISEEEFEKKKKVLLNL
ncbi:DUF4429 domain-containing protein [candidate division WWE3 bacterium]|nr:DUF4429 domain-containing protein [candidate division WWE3 bacterium]